MRESVCVRMRARACLAEQKADPDYDFSNNNIILHYFCEATESAGIGPRKMHSNVN